MRQNVSSLASILRVLLVISLALCLLAILILIGRKELSPVAAGWIAAAVVIQGATSYVGLGAVALICDLHARVFPDPALPLDRPSDEDEIAEQDYIRRVRARRNS